MGKPRHIPRPRPDSLRKMNKFIHKSGLQKMVSIRFHDVDPSFQRLVGENVTVDERGVGVMINGKLFHMSNSILCEALGMRKPDLESVRMDRVPKLTLDMWKKHTGYKLRPLGMSETRFTCMIEPGMKEFLRFCVIRLAMRPLRIEANDEELAFAIALSEGHIHPLAYWKYGLRAAIDSLGQLTSGSCAETELAWVVTKIRKLSDKNKQTCVIDSSGGSLDHEPENEKSWSGESSNHSDSSGKLNPTGPVSWTRKSKRTVKEDTSDEDGYVLPKRLRTSSIGKTPGSHKMTETPITAVHVESQRDSPQESKQQLTNLPDSLAQENEEHLVIQTHGFPQEKGKQPITHHSYDELPVDCDDDRSAEKEDEDSDDFDTALSPCHVLDDLQKSEQTSMLNRESFEKRRQKTDLLLVELQRRRKIENAIHCQTLDVENYRGSLVTKLADGLAKEMRRVNRLADKLEKSETKRKEEMLRANRLTEKLERAKIKKDKEKQRADHLAGELQRSQKECGLNRKAWEEIKERLVMNGALKEIYEKKNAPTTSLYIGRNAAADKT